MINIYTVYSEEADMTFIMKDMCEGEVVVSTEVIGFYYGEPDEEATEANTGCLKAEFER